VNILVTQGEACPFLRIVEAARAEIGCLDIHALESAADVAQRGFAAKWWRFPVKYFR